MKTQIRGENGHSVICNLQVAHISAISANVEVVLFWLKISLVISFSHLFFKGPVFQPFPGPVVPI